MMCKPKSNGHLYRGASEVYALLADEFSELTRKLYYTIKEHGPLTRADLIARFESKIPRTTIYDNIVPLVESKIVRKYGVSDGKRQRPKVYFRINPQGIEI